MKKTLLSTGKKAVVIWTAPSNLKNGQRDSTMNVKGGTSIRETINISEVNAAAIKKLEEQRKEIERLKEKIAQLEKTLNI